MIFKLVRGWLLLWLTVLVSANREHKVHNIVLYPDKHSWCKTTPIKQVVSAPGCGQVEFDNNVCVGGCFSYTIPRTIPTSPGQVKPYCDSCQPLHVTWKPVTLECDSKEVEGGVLVKKVEVIQDCGCRSCSRIRNGSDESDDADDSEETTQDSASHEDHFPHHPPSSPEGALHHHPLEVINLESIDGVKGENLSKLLKYLSNNGNQETTLSQDTLNEILSQKASLPPHQYTTMHHSQQEDEDEDKKKLKQEVLKKFEEWRKTNTPNGKHAHHNHNHPHQHHHHVHGPHHSMVMTPDETPTKRLDVKEEELKPAVEGSQIAYDAHHETDHEQHQHQHHHHAHPHQHH